jgi:hypothetical protein
MDRAACGARNSAEYASLQKLDGQSRSDAGDCLDGKSSVEGAVTVEALRSGIDKDGGQITGALVTLRRIEGEQGQYRLYVQCSWLGHAFYGVAVHRGRALRVHRTFDPWILVLDSFSYPGMVAVYREADPALGQFGLLGRPAA